MANVKKLSVATVYGKPALSALVEAQKAGKPLPAMRAAGFAVGVKTGESSFGPWQALQGDFVCWALDPAGAINGPENKSSTLFLPDIAMIPIALALSQGNQSVRFAIDIGFNVVPEASRKPGGSIYEYTFKEVLAPDTASPMAQLMLLLQPPAPATEQPAPDTEQPAPTGKKGK